jgi:pimeloyl-ACP methyl ester carboxylesterase
MRRRIIVVLLMLGVVTAGTVAQNDAPVGTPVEIVASNDGHTLKGEIYYPAESDGALLPAVLLMHQNNGRRRDWNPLIPALLDAGYVALAVDLRGFGETGGPRGFSIAPEDTQDWLAYLQSAEGVDPARTATIGASIGSNLALVGCSVNEACVTAIALSPGLNYFNVLPEPELVEGGLSEKSALLITAQNDRESSVGVRQMVTNATGEIGLRIYTGGTHGTTLFLTNAGTLIPLIVNWLDEKLAADGE